MYRRTQNVFNWEGGGEKLDFLNEVSEKFKKNYAEAGEIPFPEKILSHSYFHFLYFPVVRFSSILNRVRV